MKNSIIIIAVLVAFIAGILTILALPNNESIQFQQFLKNNHVNAPIQDAAAATDLLNVQSAPSNYFINSQSSYWITFTVPSYDIQVRTIEIQFPSGFVLTGAVPLQLPGLSGESFSISGQKLLITLSSQQILANDLFTIEVGGIINPSSINNQISVDLLDSNSNIVFGPTLSQIFTLSPVTSSMINSNAVTSTTIANNAVTSPKIANGAVGNTKILNGAVTNSKIADGNVTAAKIAQGSVSATFRTELGIFSLNPGQSNGNQIFCHNNEYAVSAGYYLSTNTGGNPTKIVVTSFYQVNPGRDWQISATNTGGVTGYVNTYLNCMTLHP